MPLPKPVAIGISIVSILVGIGAIAKALRPTIDASDADAKIRVWIAEQVAPPTSVDCPSHVREKAGVTFDCKVAFPTGRAATVHVEERDGKGDVHFYWKPSIVAADKLAAHIAHDLTGAWAGGTVDCGSGIQDVPAEGYRCTVTHGAQRERVVFTLADGSAALHDEPLP